MSPKFQHKCPRRTLIGELYMVYYPSSYSLLQLEGKLNLELREQGQKSGKNNPPKKVELGRQKDASIINISLEYKRNISS